MEEEKGGEKTRCRHEGGVRGRYAIMEKYHGFMVPALKCVALHFFSIGDLILRCLLIFELKLNLRFLYFVNIPPMSKKRNFAISAVSIK